MEYTKDMVLELRCKRPMPISKMKNGTRRLFKDRKSNKVIWFTLSLLSILMAIDVILIHSFLQLFRNIY